MTTISANWPVTINDTTLIVTRFNSKRLDILSFNYSLSV